jgi:hypothetical protein
MVRWLVAVSLLGAACTGDLEAGSPDDGDDADPSDESSTDDDGADHDAAASGDDDAQPPGDGDDGAPDGDGADGGEPDAGGADAGSDDFPGELSECPDDPSIDRLTSWLASGEGATQPATGSILVEEEGDHVGRIEFVGNEWHVVPVLTRNRFDDQADFGSARGFWLTYSATSSFYVQLRPGFAWDGGDKYLTAIASTGGDVKTQFFSFEPESWTTLSALGTPDYPFSDALAAVRGFVFVGETPNVIAFHGLRVDGYEPPCP